MKLDTHVYGHAHYPMSVIVMAVTTPVESFDWLGPSDGQFVGTGAEQVIEAAGRGCYLSCGKGRSSADFHANLLASQHGSVAEHASVTMRISGVSRNLTHELVRHSVGTAISQESTRYVDIGSRMLPGLVDMPPHLVERVSEHLRASQALYREIVDAEMARGATRKAARGLAAQVMPHGHSTSLTWTANVRALRNVIEQRLSMHAASEIRALAGLLLEVGRDVAPRWFSDYEIDDEGSAKTPWRKV